MLSSQAQRITFFTGVLFMASGLFHVGIWLEAGMPSLEGPVSWRKPITFGLSTGMLSISMAWVLGLLPDTPRLTRQAWLFSLLLIAEVALIDMQQWRGVASHFNTSTAFDGAVFSTMGVLIVTVSAIVAAWTLKLFAQPVRADGLALAARGGMVLLNAGNLIGIIMAATETTALKPMHGAALHAIQVFPVAVWLASRLGYPRAWPHALRSARSRC